MEADYLGIDKSGAVDYLEEVQYGDVYAGCDPGLNGGFVVISGDKILYKLVMPTLSFTMKDGKTKTEIDREGILSFLSIIPSHTHVAIEVQHPFRKNVSTTCTTCKNYGVLLMALTAAHMYVTEVSSDIWQPHFGIVSAKEGKGTTKEQAFHIAQKLYPGEDFRKSGKSHKFHDGIVDATLIANYCQSLFLPSNETPEQLEVKPILGAEGIVKPLEYKPGGKEPGTELKRRLL